MKPSVCRIVEVFTDPYYNNGSDTAPAVITRVWDDGLINVRVLHDGPPVPPEHRQDWLTSIPLHESRDAAVISHAAKWEHLEPEARPERPFGAFWPPRV